MDVAKRFNDPAASRLGKLARSLPGWPCLRYAARNFDFGIEFFNFIDGKLNRFRLELGPPDQFPAFPDLHFQAFQVDAVIYPSSCHGITTAVAMPVCLWPQP